MASLRPAKFQGFSDINPECLKGHCSRVEDWLRASDSDSERIVASAGPILRSLRLARKTGEPDSAVPSVFARMHGELESHIGQGAVVQIVMSYDPKQQSTATRTLLAWSLNRVTTHQFAWQPARGEHRPQKQH